MVESQTHNLLGSGGRATAETNSSFIDFACVWSCLLPLNTGDSVLPKLGNDSGKRAKVVPV